MRDTLFTKISSGEIPSHTVYEDDLTFAFLDIHPVQPGHTLIVPKKPIEFVWDLESVEYNALMQTTQKIALHLREVLGVKYIGEQVMGTDVPHAHVHLIPFSTVEQYRTIPDMSAEPDHEALAAMAAKLRLP